MKIVITYDTMTTIVSALIVFGIVGGGAVWWRSFQPSAPAYIVAPASIGAAVVGEGGSVQADVTHDPSSSAINHTFTIALTTHSGDLSTYDAKTNVVYRTSSGEELSPASVGGDRETHHRTMTVTFEKTAFPGMLIIRNLRGVPERLFSFTQ